LNALLSFKKSTLITIVMSICIAVLSAPSADAQATTQKGWKLLKVKGLDYVSVESLKNFYHFTKLTKSGKDLVLENSKVEMRLKVGGHECLMNNVKFVFSNPVIASGRDVYVSRVDLAKLIDPVLRPNFIRNAGNFQTVILDAGHGGKDPGATNSLGTEADYNLGLAQRVQRLLQSKGFKVIMLRESNRYLSLRERVEAANRVNENAIFVSLHFNSGNSRARGIETFTLSPPGVSHYGRGVVASDAQSRAGNENDSANIALATAIHGSILRRLGKNTFDRGIKRARFSVLSGVKHPAVLFEGGFMSHPYEARLIENESYQAALAAGMVDAVVRYRFAVSGGKPTSPQR
jgi:N-acetylmuramoyl-L-alanine amidase